MFYGTLAEAQHAMHDPSVIEMGIYKNTIPSFGKPLPEPWILLNAFKDPKAPTGEDILIFQNPHRRYPQLAPMWNRPNVYAFTYRWLTQLGPVEQTFYFEWSDTYGWIRVA